MTEHEAGTQRKFNTLVKGSSVYIVGTFLARILTYAFIAIVARISNPAEFGKYSLVMSAVFTITPFFLLGFNQTVQVYIPKYLTRNQPENAYGLIKLAIKYTAPLLLLTSILLYVLSSVISVILFKDQESAFIIKIMSPIPLFWGLSTLFSSIFIGFKRIDYKIYIIDILQNVSKLLLFIPLATLITPILGLSLGTSITMFVMLFAAILLFKHKLLGKLTYSKKLSSINKREIFNFTWPLAFDSILLVLTDNIGIILLGLWSTTANVGIFKAVLGIALLSNIIQLAFATIYQPTISESIAANDVSEERKLYSLMSKWLLVFSLPILYFILLFPSIIIKILLSEQYIQGSLVLMIVSIGLIGNTILGLSAVTLRSHGETKTMLIINIIKFIILLTLSIILIPMTGIYGAAIGLSLAMLIPAIIRAVLVYKKYNLVPFTKHHLYILITSLLIMTPIIVLKMRGYHFSFSALVLSIILFTFLYGASLFKLNILTDYETIALKTIKKKFLNR